MDISLQKLSGIILVLMLSSSLIQGVYGSGQLVEGDLLQSRGDTYRYDDGSYENAINWFSNKLTEDWHGWGVRFVLSGTDDVKIERIFIAMTKRNEFNSEDAVYELAICEDLAGYPDVDNYLWLSGEEGAGEGENGYYQAPQSIPFWEYTVFVEHQITPEVNTDSTFWVLFLPRWGSEIVPDPPFYLCIDTDTWMEGSYGNADSIYWYALPAIDPKYYGEFGMVVEGERVASGIQPTSLGRIKALFE